MRNMKVILAFLLVVSSLFFSSCGGSGGGGGSDTGSNPSSGSCAASVSSFTSSTSAISKGGSMTVSYNYSTSGITSTFIVYLSQDATVSSSDTTLKSQNSFSGNGSGTMTITIPSGAASGSYYLIGTAMGFTVSNGCNASKAVALTVN